MISSSRLVTGIISGRLSSTLGSSVTARAMAARFSLTGIASFRFDETVTSCVVSSHLDAAVLLEPSSAAAEVTTTAPFRCRVRRSFAFGGRHDELLTSRHPTPVSLLPFRLEAETQRNWTKAAKGMITV
jgi:hypothetical protein